MAGTSAGAKKGWANRRAGTKGKGSSSRSATKSGETWNGMKVRVYKTQASANRAMKASKTIRDKKYAQWKKKQADALKKLYGF